MKKIIKKILYSLAILAYFSGSLPLQAMQQPSLGEQAQALSRNGLAVLGRLVAAAASTASAQMPSGSSVALGAAGIGLVASGAYALSRYALQAQKPSDLLVITNTNRAEADKPFPLCNPHNMCYAIAPVQALCTIPVMHDAIRDAQGDNPLFVSLRCLVLGLYPDNSYQPQLDTYIQQSINLMTRIGQHDSNEFLDKLLDRSPQIVKDVCAIRLLTEHSTEQVNYTLQLYSADGKYKTLAQSIEALASENRIIANLSPVFIVGLNGEAKTLTSIPLQFNTKEFDPSDMLGNKNYALRVAICHWGVDMSGHYTAYVQRGENWYHANDAHISAVNKDILQEIQEHATMLFYEEINQC